MSVPAEKSIVGSEKQGELFLKTIFNGIEGKAAIALWTLEDKRTHFYKHPPKHASLSRFAGKNLYFACGLQPLDAKGNRATKKTVVGIPGLWADIDYLIEGGEHKKGDLPKSRDEAFKLVADIPLPPTFIVESGHGLHVYWLFKEPWLFESDKERIEAEALTKRWHEFILGKANKRGWTVDAVFDLSRILRVPGTINQKKDMNPVKCELIEHNPNAFVDIDSIKELTPALTLVKPDNAPSKSKDTSKEVQHSNFVMRYEAEPPMEKLTILQDNDPDFKLMWDLKKHPKQDRSPSGYDMMLTHKFCAARWSDQEIIDTLIFFRRMKLKADLKMHRPDYYANTLLKARSYFNRQGAADQLGEIQDRKQAGMQKLDDKTREEILNNVRDILRIDIERIDKYLEDPPVYFIVTHRGSMQIGTVDKIVSQTQFRYILAATCNVAMPFFKSQQWNNIVQSILDICNEVEVGSESSEEGTLITYLEEYLAGYGNRLGFDKDAAYRMRMPFQVEDRFAVFGTKFTKWLKGEQGVNMPLRQINRVMQRMGAEQRKMNFWPHSGRRTSSNVWILPYGPFCDMLAEKENEE